MLWVLIWIQKGTHNICLYKEVDKNYTGCNLKTTQLLDCALIGACAVIRWNTVFILFWVENSPSCGAMKVQYCKVSLKIKWIRAGLPSGVDNMFDCRSKVGKFESQHHITCGDWSWNNFCSHSYLPTFHLFKNGKCMCKKYWCTYWEDLTCPVSWLTDQLDMTLRVLALREVWESETPKNCPGTSKIQCQEVWDSQILEISDHL